MIEILGVLAIGGLLVYIIPYYCFIPDICRVLVDNFGNLGLWWLTDAEFKKFKQAAILGTRKQHDTKSPHITSPYVLEIQAIPDLQLLLSHPCSQDPT